MIFGGIGADNHNAVGIPDVNPVICHGTAAERFRQTGDSGGMSYAGAVLQIHHTEGPVHLGQHITLFVI